MYNEQWTSRKFYKNLQFLLSTIKYSYIHYALEFDLKMFCFLLILKLLKQINEFHIINATELLFIYPNSYITFL